MSRIVIKMVAIPITIMVITNRKTITLAIIIRRDHTMEIKMFGVRKLQTKSLRKTTLEDNEMTSLI